MRTIHFVYTVPPSNNPFLYRVDKYARKSFLFPPSYRSGRSKLINWPSPIFAPHSITYHLLKALSKRAKVKLYDWREQTVCNMKNDDIFLGHPLPDVTVQDLTAKDYNYITIKTLAKYKDYQNYIINPYSHCLEEMLLKKRIFENYCSNYIAICGKHWINTWQESPLYDAVDNLLDVRMAIDVNNYPFVKRHFNSKNKRKFLYIGRTVPLKNISQLEKIAATYKGFEGGYISQGQIRGWRKIADFANLTPEFMTNISKEYDVFINTSTFDAQATTILEQMCFGLAIACTPESGYSFPSIISLDKEDTLFNCHQIELLQNMEEEKLIELALMNREIVEAEYTWNKFCDDIINFINI